MPANVESTLNLMRRKNLSLHCEHNSKRPTRRHRTAWLLSDGTVLTDRLAAELITHPSIMPAGDTLPFSTPRRPLQLTSQTYVLRKSPSR